MLSVVWFFYVAVAIACGVADLLTYRIPNLLVALLVAGFAATALLRWNGVEWMNHLGSFLLISGVCVTFYAFGKMGAGDVKLLAAMALWSGLYGLAPLMFWVSLCGLAFMGTIVLMRQVVPSLQTTVLKMHNVPRVLTRGEGIPFGVAIGAGAVIASFSFPAWLWH